MNDSLHIDSKISDRGIEIRFQNKDYQISYPPNIWDKVPIDIKRVLRDNLALATTMHLPMILPNINRIHFSTARPLLEPYFFQNFIFDIPSCSEVDGSDIGEDTRRFLQIEFSYEKPDILFPENHYYSNKNKALIGMSFGKDSLLTFAVANEINLDPEIIYIIEESLTYEQKHKILLGEKFREEFGKTLHIINHETGKLRNYRYLGLKESEFGWGLQNTEYALEFIPFAFALKANYIFFGNEQSTAVSYLDQSGKWKIYPCYDQTHYWTKMLDQITQVFTGRLVKTGSLIEPLMDIVIQRILIRRYPEYAKYQMSCFTDSEAGKEYRWCHQCSVCAKMYLLCVASGMDPLKIGFKQNMLEKGNKKFFTLFGGKSNLTYANTGLGRDEQLFSFYQAVKLGIQSPLIEEFKESPLFEEAKNREDELIKTFLTLYEAISLPKELKKEVISIYKEELGSFEL